jgi:hypothetical protein
MKEFYELKKVYKKVFTFFNEHDKTKLWFRCPNYNFGGISPQLLMKTRGLDGLKKIDLFVKSALDERGIQK